MFSKSAIPSHRFFNKSVHPSKTFFQKSQGAGVKHHNHHDGSEEKKKVSPLEKHHRMN